MYVKSQLSEKNSNAIALRALALPQWWGAKAANTPGRPKGEAKVTGHVLLVAAAKAPLRCCGLCREGVSRQGGKEAGIGRFSAQYSLRKTGTLAKTMQITVEQETDTFTCVPAYGAIHN